jgi:hypothetical protein
VGTSSLTPSLYKEGDNLLCLNLKALELNIMNEPERKKWHQKIFVRVLALLLLPLIVAGLYIISTQIILTRPTSPTVAPDK